MKTCIRCGVTKSFGEFQSSRGAKDGKRPECKTCTRARDAERYKKDPSKKLAQRKARYRKYKDQIIEQHREYRAANPEKIYEMYKDYRSRNKERIAQWWTKSPRGLFGVLLALALKRRPTDNPISLDELMAIWERQGGRCAVSGVAMTWCQGKTQPDSISIDRIDSAKGYDKDNVRLICYQANVFKNRWTDEQMFTMALAIVANMKRPKLRLVS